MERLIRKKTHSDNHKNWNPFKIQIMQIQVICTCRPVTCQQRDCRHAPGDTARGDPSRTRLPADSMRLIAGTAPRGGPRARL